MVTGDNLLTAQAIARECGILDKHVNPSENRGYEILEG
jgi:magnesium-transporting ATPase (P-type)